MTLDELDRLAAEEGEKITGRIKCMFCEGEIIFTAQSTYHTEPICDRMDVIRAKGVEV